MKHLTLLVTGALLGSALHAQHCIVRQSGGESHFRYHDGTNAYTTLVQVISDAVDGDTIHLPGATYDISTELVIAKQLVFVGTGIDPDSTIATGSTALNVANYITLTSAASGSEFHGLRFLSGTGGQMIRFGTSPATSDVDNVAFVRCIIERNVLLNGSSSVSPSLANGTVIDGCVLNNTITVRGAAPFDIRNSVIVTENSILQAHEGTTIENCILLDATPGAGSGTAGVVYRNNIFMRNGSGIYAPTEQSTYQNNLWVLLSGGTLDLSGVLNESDNQHTSLIANVFQTPLPSFTQFNWAYNYQLVPGSPYETMGLGGTQVGIYGGGALSAWKDGALPFNPHWDQFYAPGATNGGVLQGVLLRGTAQSH